MKKMCQSCGMPLKDNRGSEKDDSLSQEFCNLCYEDGAFKDPDMTLEEMQAKYIEAMKTMYVPGFVAKTFAKSQVPKLKRWQ